MERKPAKMIGKPAKNRRWTSSRQDPPGYVQKYDQVDPANRLVAGELESRWDAALNHAVELEQQLESLTHERHELSESQRLELLKLGQDLPLLWNHESAGADLKKRILRTILDEIMIGDDVDRKNHLLVLHWKGGVHTELIVTRNQPGKCTTDTSRSALELIEELSKVCSDQTIAATLNRLGYKTGAGKTWRLHSVHNARYIHKLTNHRNSNDWITVQGAADELKVSQTVVRRLIREGKLAATQLEESTPWIIARKAIDCEAVQTDVEAVRNGRQLKKRNPDQQQIPFK